MCIVVCRHQVSTRALCSQRGEPHVFSTPRSSSHSVARPAALSIPPVTVLINLAQGRVSLTNLLT